MSVWRYIEWPVRYLVAGLLAVLALYCAALLLIAFAAAFTLPLWIWWCV